MRRRGHHRARSRSRVAALAAIVIVVAASCTGGGHTSDRGDAAPGGAGDTAPADGPSSEDLEMSGGQATVHNTGVNAFAQPAPGLSGEERRAFVVGNNFFNDNWVTAPASTTGRDGLGPLFNAQSCSSCHFKDGRGQPPSEQDPNALGLLLRLSVPGTDEHGGPLPDPVYGGQLQDKAINRVPAEGSIQITTTEVHGEFDDGTPYTLLEPHYSIGDPGYGPPSPELMISPRVAPPVFGVGLLEVVPEEQILELAEAQDAAGGGVSGRPNMVWSPSAQATVLGRFGWKANVATVEEQTAGAFHGDIGITSSLHPAQDCTPAQPECLAAPAGGEPELDDQKLERVTFYTRTLAVPARREVGEPTTDRGAELFDELQCSACHVAELTTGPTLPEPLSEQTIRPYTDLLLHDMGPGLADERPDFLATGSEWRTAPLWGIGLTRTVNRHTRFLHDGRARDLNEAILWHGGEATAAQQGYLGLDREERDALISFLNSL
jgi:CxxC motif-containing protein (DUF1111 family)